MKIFDNNDDRELSECALNDVRNVILVKMNSAKRTEERAIQEEMPSSYINTCHDTYLLWKTLLAHLNGMNVIYTGYDESDSILCPVCGYEVARNDDYPEMRPKHCPECGCKLLYKR